MGLNAAFQREIYPSGSVAEGSPVSRLVAVEMLISAVSVQPNGLLSFTKLCFSPPLRLEKTGEVCQVAPRSILYCIEAKLEVAWTVI